MGGHDSSHAEHSKSYPHSVGRGGIGNLEHEKIFEGIAAPPLKVDHVVYVSLIEINDCVG